MKTILYTFLLFILFLYLSLVPLPSFSSYYTSLYSVPQGSRSFVILNGSIYLGTSNGIFYMPNDTYILKGYNITSLAYLNGFYFITSNDTLFYFNGSEVIPINVSYPQKIFIDPYTNEVYVTSYNYVYIINGTHVVKSYYIYESFGYVTFTKTYAIVDSQAGFTFLYYNGSQRTTDYYQDALTWMTFGNSTFIVGSFSPNGLWIFTNLSVLNLSVIPVNYFSQLRYYNIVYVPLPFTPYWIYYNDGLIFVAGNVGYAIVDPENNYQVIYVNYTTVYDAQFYDNAFYLLTNEGLLKIVYTPPPIYSLVIKEVGLPNGYPWTVIINGTKYTVYNNTLTLRLAGDEVYNITFSNYLSFKPNVTSILLNLTKNSLLVVNYADDKVPVNIIIKGIENNVKWILNISGISYEETGSEVTVQLYNSTSYFITLSIPGYNVFPENLYFIVQGNTTLVFTATPIVSTSTVGTATITGSTSEVGSSNSQLFILVGTVLLVVVIFIIWVVRRVVSKKGLSDIIGFLIILIILIVVVLPILYYVTYSYSNSLVPPTQPQPNLGFINVTYFEQQGNEILKIQYASGTTAPVVLNIYNYSAKGVWVQAKYEELSSTEYKIEGPANDLVVELSYLNEIFYVQVGLNSSVLVG